MPHNADEWMLQENDLSAILAADHRLQVGWRITPSMFTSRCCNWCGTQFGKSLFRLFTLSHVGFALVSAIPIRCLQEHLLDTVSTTTYIAFPYPFLFTLNTILPRSPSTRKQLSVSLCAHEWEGASKGYIRVRAKQRPLQPCCLRVCSPCIWA